MNTLATYMMATANLDTGMRDRGQVNARFGRDRKQVRYPVMPLGKFATRAYLGTEPVVKTELLNTAFVPRGNKNQYKKVGHAVGFKKCPGCEQYGAMLKLKSDTIPGLEGSTRYCPTCGYKGKG